jgi:hypothetical protein
MDPDIPPAPPEAKVIKLAREAAGLTIQAASEKSRHLDPEGKGVSPVYWGSVERGTGGRRGQKVPARASAMKLALMGRTTGVEPRHLAEAGRPDAARVLDEILRREIAGQAQSAPPPETPSLVAMLPPVVAAQVAPLLAQIRKQVADVRQPGRRLAGEDIFDDGNRQLLWDSIVASGLEMTLDGFTDDEVAELVAVRLVTDRLTGNRANAGLTRRLHLAAGGAHVTAP